ncbi:MAG: hypothetical protein IKI11_11440 [Neisseriaceae bacterium]|nr:hypothetical protein [Neisseriaceae bacterium]
MAETNSNVSTNGNNTIANGNNTTVSGNNTKVTFKVGEMLGKGSTGGAIYDAWKTHNDPNASTYYKINADGQAAASVSTSVLLVGGRTVGTKVPIPVVAIPANAGAATLTVGKILDDNQKGNPISPSDITSVGGNAVVIIGTIAAAGGSVVALPVAAGIVGGLWVIGKGLDWWYGRNQENDTSNTDPTTPNIDPITPFVPTPENPTWNAPFPIYPLSPKLWSGGYWDDGTQCLAPWTHNPDWSRFNEYHIVDPLVLDLNGDGIKAIAQNGYYGAMFDFNANGICNATGWVSPDDGLLVFDRNGNGIIDNGTELFGDSTPLMNGSIADNGFTALADLDSNQDGKITAEDSHFAQLKVWQDANSDGISQANELFTLQQLGITALNVPYKNSNQNLGNGNTLAQVGSFEKQDGTTGKMGDVNLSLNSITTMFSDSVELTEKQATRANILGTGRVRDLREAAANDEFFAQYATAFQAA